MPQAVVQLNNCCATKQIETEIAKQTCVETKKLLCHLQTCEKSSDQGRLRTCGHHSSSTAMG